MSEVNVVVRMTLMQDGDPVTPDGAIKDEVGAAVSEALRQHFGCERSFAYPLDVELRIDSVQLAERLVTRGRPRDELYSVPIVSSGVTS